MKKFILLILFLVFFCGGCAGKEIPHRVLGEGYVGEISLPGLVFFRDGSEDKVCSCFKLIPCMKSDCIVNKNIIELCSCKNCHTIYKLVETKEGTVKLLPLESEDIKMSELLANVN